MGRRAPRQKVKDLRKTSEPEPERIRMSETTKVREGEGFDAGTVENLLREKIDDLPEGELEIE